MMIISFIFHQGDKNYFTVQFIYLFFFILVYQHTDAWQTHKPVLESSINLGQMRKMPKEPL